MSHSGYLYGALLIVTVVVVTALGFRNTAKAGDSDGFMTKLSNAVTGGHPLPIGTRAPDFELPATGNHTLSLSHYFGKNLILVFYPMDQTPGCTTQLCALRDNLHDIGQLNASVLASNPASLQSHEAFAKRQHYPFPILVDKDKLMAKAYHASGPIGINIRTVYIIDKHGIIRYAKRGTPSVQELEATLSSLPN